MAISGPGKVMEIDLMYGTFFSVQYLINQSIFCSSCFTYAVCYRAVEIKEVLQLPWSPIESWKWCRMLHFSFSITSGLNSQTRYCMVRINFENIVSNLFFGEVGRNVLQKPCHRPVIELENCHFQALKSHGNWFCAWLFPILVRNHSKHFPVFLSHMCHVGVTGQSSSRRERPNSSNHRSAKHSTPQHSSGHGKIEQF